MSDRTIKPEGKIFRDPIHDLIRIGPEDWHVVELIDTPEFQRLRRIRQLGVGSLTFHGAEHSRFAHSMGVFNFAQRIVDALCRRHAGEDAVTAYLKEHRREVTAAALLHDVGHGPFSHMIERAFGAHGKHEEMTTRLIQDKETGIHKTLVRAKIDPAAVAEIINHTSKHKLLVDIVSSQLDADRMDYLLRDSYYAGVAYGRYDAEWLLNALCIGKDPHAHAASHGDDASVEWRLCLDKKRGVYAAEQFIMARAHMSEQVYFHRATRGYEVLLLNLFDEAKRACTEGRLPSDTPVVVRSFLIQEGNLDSQGWLTFDESVMTTAFHAWARSAEKRLSRLAGAYLNRERIYRGVSLPDASGPEFYEDLNGSDLKRDVDWRIDKGEYSVYKGLLSGSATQKDAEEFSTESMLFSDGDIKKKASAGEAHSELFRDLDRVKRKLWRFYYDSAQEDKFRPVLVKHKLMRA